MVLGDPTNLVRIAETGYPMVQGSFKIQILREVICKSLVYGRWGLGLFRVC